MTKKIIALVLATAMVFGCTITAFAEESSEGTGSYEGGEMQYPELSVTLPTIPANTYDYIADPNGLIALTSAAAHSDSTFTGSTGIFFKTTPKTDAEGSKDLYTNKSAALTVTNQNAQDIDVTVKLEQKTAGADGIAYSDTDSFETSDKDKKLYLAITDDAATDPQTAALSASAAATITTKVDGEPDNYDPGWTSEGGYKYAVKTPAEGQTLTWNDCSFCLTGALNTNASWEDGLTFPTIKVTWSYAEHSDTPASYLSAASISESNNSLTMTLPDGVTLSKIELFKASAPTTAVTMVANSHYTVSGSTYTFKSDMVSKWTDGNLVFTYSDDHTDTVAIN
jgi:hypothetical protein